MPARDRAMYKPWNVLHVDLSVDLPALPANPEIQGLYLVFWWKEIPLGELKVPENQLPMPASQLAERAIRAITPVVGNHLMEQGFKAPLPVRSPRPTPPADFDALKALERPLERLHEQLALSPEDRSCGASVSVIVCTRDRPEQLTRCLDALGRLSAPPKEILVVDNAPRSDETRRLIEKRPGIRYVREPRPGLSVARNTGIRHSTGDVIAFTDDDVIVHRDWTIRLQQALARPDVLAATGLILPAELETEAQFLFQQGHGDFGWGYRALTFDARFFEQMKHRGVPVWHIGAGANMAFQREAFDRVGLFDERLGAGAAGCSEDSEMWYRIIAEGGRCRYEPTAVVYHRHRTDMEGLRHQMYHYMRGHVAGLLTQFEKYGHWGNLYRTFGILPRYYTRLLLRHALNASNGKTLKAQALGCLAGIKYYLQHRNDPEVSPPSSGRVPAPLDTSDRNE